MVQSTIDLQHEDVGIANITPVVALRARHQDIVFAVGTTICPSLDVLDGSHVLPASFLVVLLAPRVLSAVAASMVLLLAELLEPVSAIGARKPTIPLVRQQRDLIPLVEVDAVEPLSREISHRCSSVLLF